MSLMQQSGAQNPATTISAVRMLTGSATAPRLAMRGVSMLPLLREPMVLQLGPRGAHDRVGDVVVFENNGQLVAHRVTSLRGGKIQTCGDAMPWSPEYPDPSAIIGKAVAVFAHDGPSALRLDTKFFHIRGYWKARLRVLRAVPYVAWRIAYAMYRRTVRPIIRRGRGGQR